MSGKPTFHMSQDWVALIDLGPAARTVLGLLHCNALFGRNGLVTHTVHVTSSWFTEMTAHWKKPLSAPTARRGMNELIEKGVLTRLNKPNDGAGFIVSFVLEPGPDYEGPVNGFEHAKSVSKRCGTKALYERRDEKGELPPVQPMTAPKPVKKAPAGDLARELDSSIPDVKPSEESEFDMSGLDSASAVIDPFDTELTMTQQEFAIELETATSNNPEERLRLMAGQCARIARAAEPALKRGWEPGALARRLASELNPKIHSPEALLKKKVGDVGDPPVKPEQASGDVLFIKGKLVDVSDYDPGFGYGPAPAPTSLPIPEDEPSVPVATKEPIRRGTKEERLAELARRHMRRS